MAKTGYQGRGRGDRVPFFRIIRRKKSREYILDGSYGSVIQIYIILFIFIFLIGKIVIILVLVERVGSPTELKTFIKVRVLRALRVLKQVLERVLNLMLICKLILPAYSQFLTAYIARHIISSYFGRILDIMSLLAEPLVNFAGADIKLRRAFNEDWGQRALEVRVYPSVVVKSMSRAYIISGNIEIQSAIGMSSCSGDGTGGNTVRALSS